MATQVAVNYRLRPKYYEKLLFLFETYAVGDPHLTRSEIAQLQADEQALYSITPAQDANTMSRLCANLPGMRDLGRKPVITDGCACVGGNVMSFALSGAYAQVNAVEFDESRARMLEHNVNVIRGRAPCTVNIVTGSYIALMHTLSQDIVFLDPPWGGTDYENGESVKLELGGKTVTDIIEYLENSSHTQLVFWKAPEINYDEHDMNTQMSGLGLTMNEVTGFRKMKLFYVNLRVTAAEASQDICSQCELTASL